VVFFFSSRRRHTRSYGDWSSDVCSSDLVRGHHPIEPPEYLLLDLEVLVHLLDDDVRAGERRVLAHAPNEAERGVGLRASQAPARSEERRVGKEWRYGGASAR